VVDHPPLRTHTYHRPPVDTQRDKTADTTHRIRQYSSSPFGPSSTTTAIAAAVAPARLFPTPGLPPPSALGGLASR
jgi:hypothetical protein